MTGAPNSKAAQQGQDIKASFGSIFSKPALEYFWAWMWWFQLCHLKPALEYIWA
jgi:hypothetical protein